MQQKKQEIVFLLLNRYDSNPETTSDSESGEEGEEKKSKEKKKKEKKPKAEKVRFLSEGKVWFGIKFPLMFQ